MLDSDVILAAMAAAAATAAEGAAEAAGSAALTGVVGLEAADGSYGDGSEEVELERRACSGGS